METPSSSPLLPPVPQIELEASTFNPFNTEMKSITLETMKEILRQLYKDPLVFNAKEANVMKGLKARKLI